MGIIPKINLINNKMKEQLHKALDLVLEARDNGIKNIYIEVNVNVDLIRFYHLNESFKKLKGIGSYFSGSLSDHTSPESDIIPFSDFTPTLQNYLQSVTNESTDTIAEQAVSN